MYVCLEGTQILLSHPKPQLKENLLEVAWEFFFF